MDIINIAVIIATLILATATFMMARSTKRAAVATEKTIEALFKPCVIMYLQIDKQGGCLDLVIENIGTAPAYDITFTIPENFPQKAWSHQNNKNEFEDEIELLNSGPLKDGMHYLAPKGKYISLWGNYHGLSRALNGEPKNISISFKSAVGHEEKIRCVLNINDFAKASEEDVPRHQEVAAIKKQAESLQKIERHLAKLAARENK